MSKDNVTAAFELLLEEIDGVAEKTAELGAKTFKAKDYDGARRLIAPGKNLKAFREKVALLLQEWKRRLKTETRNRLKARKAHRGRGNQRPPFNFDMVNIPDGSKLVFVPTGATVTVMSRNLITYNEKSYKLSPFVAEFITKEQANSSGSYQGAKYFTFNGKLLTDLRNEMEKRANRSVEHHDSSGAHARQNKARARC